MTPFEVIVVASTIAVGTYLSNTLVTQSISLLSDLNTRLLCSEPSTKPFLSSTLLYTYHNFLRLLLTLGYSSRSPSSTTASAATTSPRGYLASLPQRQHLGPVSKPPSSNAEKATSTPPSHLRALIFDLASTYTDHVYLGHSTFTPSGNISLLSRSRISTTTNTNNNDTTTTTASKTHYHGEILHIHASNNTTHIALHPSDISLAASTGWIQNPSTSFGGRSGYITLLPPRNDPSEIATIKQIFKAAIWYARGHGDGTLTEEESVLTLPALLDAVEC